MKNGHNSLIFHPILPIQRSKCPELSRESFWKENVTNQKTPKNRRKVLKTALKYSKLKTAITPSVFMRFYPTKAQNVRNLAENLLGKSKQKAKTQKNRQKVLKNAKN